MQGSSLKTPGSVFAKLVEEQGKKKDSAGGRGDAFVYFVGARGAGKSTLLNRFLYPDRVEVPKPSEGLEYTFARRPSQFDHERKDLAHIWEVSGSPDFADAFVQGDAGFLSPKQVTTAVIVVVVDLSDPAAALPALLTWLHRIRSKLGSTFAKFEKKGLAFPEQLRLRAKSKLYGHNEDKDVVSHTGISIMIAATKFDALQAADSEVKKVVARTLRFIAHANGAFLTYLGSLHTPSASSTERALMEQFSRTLNHLMFTGLEKKPSCKLPPHLDHLGPIMVPAGADRFKDIGRPRGVVDADVMGGLKEWQELYEKFFPPKAAKGKAAEFKIGDNYAEPEVDLVAQRKKAELEASQRDSEQRELMKKKAAAQKGSSSSSNGSSGGGDKPARKHSSSSSRAKK